MASPFSENKLAYSIGICEDVSWDSQMADKGYEIFQYDHTIKGLPVNRPEFHWYKVGLTGDSETENMKNLSTLVKENGHEHTSGMILKMDIEGSEWNVIKNTDESVLKQFDQIVVEFHKLLDENMQDEILSILKKLDATHQVIHVHGNNGSIVDFRKGYVTPNLLEVTYLLRDKYNFVDEKVDLPIKIDQPNISNIPDYILGDWNWIED